MGKKVINLINNYKNVDLPVEINLWLKKQENYSMVPPKTGLLVETFTRKKTNYKKSYMVAYTFQGRSANQTLGMVILKKMLNLKLNIAGVLESDTNGKTAIPAA